MRFYGVAGAYTESVIEVFHERRDAEAMVAEVFAAEPEPAGRFRIEAVELGEGFENRPASSTRFTPSSFAPGGKM